MMNEFAVVVDRSIHIRVDKRQRIRRFSSNLTRETFVRDQANTGRIGAAAYRSAVISQTEGRTGLTP